MPELVFSDLGDSGSFADTGTLPATITLNALLPGDTSTGGASSDLNFNELFRFMVTNTQSSKAVS